MDQSDFAKNAARLTRALHRDVLFLHEISTLLLLDLAEGTEFERLDQRTAQLMEAAERLQQQLKEFDSGGRIVCFTDPMIGIRACGKCLLQPGEERNAS